MASLVKSCRFSFSSSVRRRFIAGVRLWSSSNENKEVTVKEKGGRDLTEHVNPEDLVTKLYKAGLSHSCAILFSGIS